VWQISTKRFSRIKIENKPLIPFVIGPLVYLIFIHSTYMYNYTFLNGNKIEIVNCIALIYFYLAPITRQICTNNLQDDICDLETSSYIFAAEKIEICPENDDYCRYPNDLSTHGCYKRTYTEINYMCEGNV
jgi:hypothetical protein